MLLFAFDGAGLALLGASVDPTAIASGMRDARQGRSQVNGLVFVERVNVCCFLRPAVLA